MDFKWCNENYYFHWIKEKLLKIISRNHSNSIPIIYADEKPLGTGGALIYSSKFLSNNQNFLLTNGDTLFKIDVQELLIL